MAPRQPNGNPAIYLGADGDYHCYKTVGRKPNGSPDRKHFRGKTATEVLRKMKASDDKQRRTGVATVGRSETVEAWLLHWLEHVVRPAKSYKTWAGRRSLIRTHVNPRIGKWRLDGSRNALRPEHLDALYAAMRSVGLADNYVNQTHRVLHKAFNDAMRRGRMSHNPCDMIDPPSPGRVRIKAHTLAEAQRIIEAASADPLAPRWLIGIVLGLRQGEVLGLHWDDLFLDDDPPTLRVEMQVQRHTWQHGCGDPVECVRRRGRCNLRPCRPPWIHGCAEADPCGKVQPYRCPRRRPDPDRHCVEHTRACPPPCPPDCDDHAQTCPQRKDGGLVETRTKGEKSDRNVAIPVELVDSLRAWRERRMGQLRRGEKWDPARWVFEKPSGGPLDPRKDHDAWEKLLVKAGVADSRLHAARHTAGTLMLATGTDIRVVQEVLGHSRITVTEVYTDVADGLKKEAVDRVASALFDGGLAALLSRSPMKS